MKLFYTDQFALPLPAGHRFPMRKYTLLRRRLVAEGVIANEQLWLPQAATNAELIRVHNPDYVERVARGDLSDAEIRRLGFPWSPELVERSRRSCGATIQACRAALKDGYAVNLAGGTHHAFADRGEGFCVFNDSAVAARALQAENLAGKILIIDCDVHQGNGTAHIFRGDSSVFTFSIHGEKNYPLKKEVSDLDIALPKGTGDPDYLRELQNGLRSAIMESEAQLAIYLAGADPFRDDRFGTLALSKAGLRERDRMVFDACADAGIPVVVTMAGGYAREIADIVDIHFQTVAAAVRRQTEVASPC